VWGSGDVSQKALWDDYAAAYLSHKDSVEMLFITDTGASGLSRFTGPYLTRSSSGTFFTRSGGFSPPQSSATF
jgi:hypothetical protein